MIKKPLYPPFIIFFNILTVTHPQKTPDYTPYHFKLFGIRTVYFIFTTNGGWQ